MILTKDEIYERLQSTDPSMIDPIPERSEIGPISVNLRLGRNFTSFKPGAGQYIDAINLAHVSALYDSVDLWDHHDDHDSYILQSREFVLAQTFQKVHMPSDLMGMVEGRSSLARIGLAVHLTAPKIDPGFEGTITLEITNIGPFPVRLVAETDELAQLIFVRLSSKLQPEDTYGADESNMFQAQDRPTPIQRPSSSTRATS